MSLPHEQAQHTSGAVNHGSTLSSSGAIVTVGSTPPFGKNHVTNPAANAQEVVDLTVPKAGTSRDANIMKVPLPSASVPLSDKEIDKDVPVSVQRQKAK